MTVIELAAKEITTSLDQVKKAIETASKALADKQIKEVLVAQLESCVKLIETMLSAPKTPTAKPAGAMTDGQCKAKLSAKPSVAPITPANPTRPVNPAQPVEPYVGPGLGGYMIMLI